MQRMGRQTHAWEHLTSKATFILSYNCALCDKGNSASVSYNLQQVLREAGKLFYPGEIILLGLGSLGFSEILECGEGF